MPNANARRNAQERRRQEAWLWDPIVPGDNCHRGEPHEPEWQVLAPGWGLTRRCIEPALQLGAFGAAVAM